MCCVHATHLFFLPRNRASFAPARIAGEERTLSGVAPCFRARFFGASSWCATSRQRADAPGLGTFRSCKARVASRVQWQSLRQLSAANSCRSMPATHAPARARALSARSSHLTDMPGRSLDSCKGLVAGLLGQPVRECGWESFAGNRLNTQSFVMRLKK